MRKEKRHGAIALLEFENVAAGILASDVMVKRSPIALLRCGSIHPGRFLVLMPTESHIGVSRRIGNIKERRRLREIINRIRPHDYGCIVRTEAEGCSEEDLRADLEYLARLWEKIQKKSETTPAPNLIHAELDPVLKAGHADLGLPELRV